MQGTLARVRILGIASALSIASLGVVGTVPAAAAAVTSTWNVTVGASAPPPFPFYGGLNGFYPKDITVHAGDKVDFNWQGFHTVTFNPPSNLSLLDFAFTGTPTASSSLDTPTTFVNGTPAGGGPGSPPPPPFELTIGNNLPAGEYEFRCRIHQFMAGVIRVTNGALPRTDAQNQALAAQQEAADAAQGTKLDSRLIKQTAQSEGEAVAGASNKVTELINFYPSFYSLTDVTVQPPVFIPNYIKIKVGDELTFTNRDFHEPHTVTFGNEPGNPQDPFAAVPPSGSGNPNAFDGISDLNSGWLFHESQYDYWNLKVSQLSAAVPRTTFSVTFTKPGLYPFYCAIHGSPHPPNSPFGPAGFAFMAGTVQVLPADGNNGGGNH